MRSKRGDADASAGSRGRVGGLSGYRQCCLVLRHVAPRFSQQAAVDLHPRVLYISYDGAAEPLGQSQIVAYLELLAETAEITLISFEKSTHGREAIASRLATAGVRWVPLSYHARPPVASTWWDVVTGTRAIEREAQARRPDIVHVRSYVPALMAYRSSVLKQARLLFDIRGFWADERVEGGIWRRGAIYRVAKTYERRFFRAADAVVTLTHASVPYIEAWVRDRDIPIEVIPTCVDIERYELNGSRPNGPHAVWNGSLGTWYRFDLAIRLVRELGFPLTVVTRQTDLAREMLGGEPAEVMSLQPAEVPAQLREGDIGLCLCERSFSKVASAPTRFGEYLATGCPVAVTPGLGDLEDIVERHGIGVVLRDEDDDSLRRAARALQRLASDPMARERCRAVARERFSLDVGTARYASLYRS